MLISEIESVLDTIRPAMQADGGNVQVLDVVNGVVSVRLHGTCVACPSKNLTLKLGIEKTLRATLPWVKQVVGVE